MKLELTKHEQRMLALAITADTAISGIAEIATSGTDNVNADDALQHLGSALQKLIRAICGQPLDPAYGGIATPAAPTTDDASDADDAENSAAPLRYCTACQCCTACHDGDPRGDNPPFTCPHGVPLDGLCKCSCAQHGQCPCPCDQNGRCPCLVNDADADDTDDTDDADESEEDPEDDAIYGDGYQPPKQSGYFVIVATDDGSKLVDILRQQGFNVSDADVKIVGEENGNR